jgi:hypothetical protein
MNEIGEDAPINVTKIQNELGKGMTYPKIEAAMIKYLKRENLDLSGHFVFSRKTLSDFVFKTYGVQLS